MSTEWTILGYLAGDNNLSGAAIDDINEMEIVGSTKEVNVVVQVDRAADYNRADDNWRSTRRYYITQDVDRKKITSKLLEDLGPTNTGDSRFIKDFIRDARHAYEAKRYCLILWNHGSGFYVPPEMLTGADGPSRREIDTRARHKLNRSFFHASREKIFSLPPKLRGICYDDASNDCLDNKELQQVLAYMQDQIGGAKIDVVGMDACLMTMIEIAYQIRNHARFLVGSEESEPGAGWPYDLILADVASTPTMEGGDLAKCIVNRYIESYDKPGPFDGDVTQAAIDLGKLTSLVTAVDQLAKVLLEKIPTTVRNDISDAYREATKFYENMYVDLYHLVDNLATFTSDPAVKTSCTDVKDIIDGGASPIVSEKHLGAGMANVRGLSIYMPAIFNPSDYYRELDFANDTKWADFLEAFLTFRRRTVTPALR
jgi:hypothetical protein